MSGSSSNGSSSRAHPLLDREAVVDSRPPLVQDAFVLPLAEWTFRGAGVEVQPGTWCRIPSSWQGPKGVLALIGCPNCHEAMALVKGVHTVDPYGKVTPTFRCTGRGMQCGFARTVYLDEYSKKPLYALALERRTSAGYEPEIVYTHASSAPEALKQLGYDARNVRVVAIGRAVGFRALDKDGKVGVA